MKLTTGYEFQGYFITEYLDVIFDEMLVGLGLGRSLAAALDNMFSAMDGTEATEMVDKLNEVKLQLRQRVIDKAKQLGADGLIGIDFESSKLGDLIMVSMTATAVKLDRIVSPLPLLQTQQDRKCTAERKVKETEVRDQGQDQDREELREPGVSGFDKVSFWRALNEFQTAREMIEYVRMQSAQHPDILTDSLVSSIGKYQQLERMYGKGAGRKDILNVVGDYLDLH